MKMFYLLLNENVLYTAEVFMQNVFKKLYLIILFIPQILHGIDLQVLSNTQTSTAEISNKNTSTYISVKPQDYSKTKCLMLCLSKDSTLLNLAKIIKFDLEFTDQLEIDLKKTDVEPSDKILSKLFNEGTSLCIYIKHDKSPPNDNKLKNIEIILKDTFSQSVLLTKSYRYHEKTTVLDTHKISATLLSELTGQEGQILSTIAYCKQISSSCKAVCIADYACKQEKILYSSKMINIAPRWHTQAPVLLFSQLTKENTRLVSLNLHSNKTKVVCSYDGLNMQPSFSEDGTKTVLCLSGKKNSEIYLYDQTLCNRYRKKIFTQLTHNGGNNASPCLLPNEDVVFCSDFETGTPQIYYLDTQNKRVKRLTNGKGYCAAPSYCKNNHSIVYCRLQKGFFQLFTIDLNKKYKIERQLTGDGYSKQEPVWSECGNYVAFSTDCFDLRSGHLITQIAILNIKSGKTRVLTSDQKNKSFPCWINKTLYN